jgi:predicted metal-dependent phosphoesterase TrpH
MSSFRVDLHVHTRETSFCGRTKGQMVAVLYKKAGYDGIVITDHYNKGYFRRFPKWMPWEKKIDHFLRGYRSAYAEGEKIGLKVFFGIELKFNKSPREYLVYGIDAAFLKDYPELYKLGLEKFRRLVDSLAPKYKILIFQAHPFRPGITPADPALLDGVEVYNGNPRQNSHNDLAFSFAKKHNLKMISGSDFHRLPDLARGGVVFRQAIKEPGDLLTALATGEHYQLITKSTIPFSFLRVATALVNQVKKLRRSRTPRCGPLS